MLLKRFLVWSAYITADSIAAFCLGILLNNLTQIYDDHNSKLLDANTQLTAFWAPFLLLHMGGPDTITAYALEDNELWSRHLFGLVVHTGMALSVMLMAWTASNLSVLFIIMFIPGLIKYGERTWVLWSASKSKRRESTLKEGIRQFPLQLSGSSPLSEELKLLLGYHFLNLCKHLMVDATVDVSNGNANYDVIANILAKDAFKVIEIELGLMFDLLFTKAPLLYTRWGLGQRLITSVLTCSLLVLFPVHVGAHFHRYSTANISITLLLIIMAVVLDIYSALLLLFSDRFLIWLIKHNRTSTVKTLQSSSLLKSPRWSNNMSQCSLLSFNTHKVKPQLCCNFFLRDWYCPVTNDVRELIFLYIKEKAEEQARTRQVPFAALPPILGFGDQQHENNGNSIIPSTNIRGEFEKRIVIFHIATEVLYHLDKEHFTHSHHRRKLIKRLSRYMLYLLKEHPAMLLAENSQINFKGISNAASWYANLLPGEREISKVDAYKTLYQKFIDPAFQYRNFPVHVRLLNEGMKLAEDMNSQRMDQRWMKIENSWLDMLGYAARRSKVDEHAQMLRRGGEFLTQVWLLLAHFGLTSNFQIIP
ncbi:hypothetical protein Q3G72_033243 [Acer saccharum]|nr:hypothetical protein Q3G72_033243 [Acer saccharum]